MTSPAGALSSPNHPDTYEHNLDCEWIIRVTPEERVRMIFTNLELEGSTNCRFDFVEVILFLSFPFLSRLTYGINDMVQPMHFL